METKGKATKKRPAVRPRREHAAVRIAAYLPADVASRLKHLAVDARCSVSDLVT